MNRFLCNKMIITMNKRIALHLGENNKRRTISRNVLKWAGLLIFHRPKRFIHHGDVGAGAGRKRVPAGAVDPKQSADVSCIDLVHILKHDGQTGSKGKLEYCDAHDGSQGMWMWSAQLAGSEWGTKPSWTVMLLWCRAEQGNWCRT